MSTLSNYPDDVTGQEPELSGEWRCNGCARFIDDLSCCFRHRCWTPIEGQPGDGYAPDHCRECCQL